MNAYEIQALKDMGIDLSRLGCVMLDVQIPDLTDVIPPEWRYSSANPARGWVNGLQTDGHVTLLYGLLSNANAIRPAVDEVLLTRALRDAHARLSLLPHIDTHPTYRPHVTLAYVHRDRTEDAIYAIRRHYRARDVLVPITFDVVGLNYGRPE